MLLLNLPPDRRGLLHSKDSLHIALLNQGIRETFGKNLLAGSRANATNNRGAKFDAKYLIDNDKQTYYAGRDGNVKSCLLYTSDAADE